MRGAGRVAAALVVSLAAGCASNGGGASAPAGGSTGSGSNAIGHKGFPGSSAGAGTSSAPTGNDPLLQQGSSGQPVSDLQTLLNFWRAQEGYAALAVDGKFGSHTAAAVQHFQAEHGLAVSGDTPQDTWNALRAPLASDVFGTIDPLGTPTAPDVYAAHTGFQVLIHELPAVEVQPGVFAQPLLYQSCMSIDADGAGTAWQSDPSGQPSTSLRYANGDSLDPTAIPYFVLPLGFEAQHAGVHLGDVAAVIYGNHVTYAIYGDEGPRGKIGEASIATAQALSINPNPVNGGPISASRTSCSRGRASGRRSRLPKFPRRAATFSGKRAAIRRHDRLCALRYWSS